MTITRSQLQQQRDSYREHANSRAHSASIGRALNEAATAIDQADAVLAREGIETLCIEGGDESGANGQEA